MSKVLPLVMIIILFSCSKNNDPNTLNSDDRLFISSLIQSHKHEIRESRNALYLSQHPAVRKFASGIIRQYTADQAYVMDVVSKVGYDMNDTATVSLQSDISSRDLTGFDYDTAYMKSRVRSHQVLMEQYRNEINNGNHTYVRYNLVNQGLDRVRKNWLMADSIARSF